MGERDRRGVDAARPAQGVRGDRVGVEASRRLRARGLPTNPVAHPHPLRPTRPPVLLAVGRGGFATNPGRAVRGNRRCRTLPDGRETPRDRAAHLRVPRFDRVMRSVQPGRPAEFVYDRRYPGGVWSRRTLGKGTRMIDDPVKRCEWALGDPALLVYHDAEWGTPEHDDRKLFEFLVLEGAQAGLSWLSGFKKSEAVRKAFHGFDSWKGAPYESQTG